MAVIEKNGALMEFPLRIKRQYGAALDTTSIWYDLEEAKAYAKSGATSYPGQIIAVADEKTKTVSCYKINIDGELAEVGGKLDIVSSSEAQSILDKHFASLKG